MLNEYLARIQAITEDLRVQLDNSDTPAEVEAKIRERLEQMEQIADQYKKP